MNKNLKHIVLPLVLLLTKPCYSQSIEDMLVNDQPTQKKTIVQKKSSDSVLVETLEKLVTSKKTDHNVVYRAIESNDWASAVIQYPKAFESNAFLGSTNGIAMMAILQFHAGLKITALETLFKINNPKDIHVNLKKYLSGLITVQDPAWTMAKINWTASWATVFNPAVTVWIDSLNFETKSIDELTKISKTLESDTKEKSFVDWHLAVKYSLTDKSEKAAQLLTLIRNNPNSMISPDLIQLTAGRILFQNSYYDSAIKQYEKVSKASNYWTQAQEEIGWSYIRKGQPNNAVAIGQSLIHPGLKNMVGSESFFMMSLAQLKICDYPAVISTLSSYSKNFKIKNAALKKLTTSTEDQNVEAFFNSKNKAQKNVQFNMLPVAITADRKLNGMIDRQIALENESEIAEALYAKSLALTGLQGHFETLKKNTLARFHAAKAESTSRIKFLANSELGNIKDSLDKLHIVEAEVIQQISVADQIAGRAKDDGKVKVGVTGSKSTEAVNFALEKEVWFDEIGSYKVDVKKACAAPAQKEKTL